VAEVKENREEVLKEEEDKENREAEVEEVEDRNKNLEKVVIFYLYTDFEQYK
jgi:hypothetical protein